MAIIALLLSILLPSLKQARAQARTRVCNSGMRQIATAWLTYATEWRDSLPGSVNDLDTNNGGCDRFRWNRMDWLGTAEVPGCGGSQGGEDPNLVPVKGSIYRYVGDSTAIFKCPEDAIERQVTTQSGEFRYKTLYSYTSSKMLTGAPTQLLKRQRWAATFPPNFNWTTGYNLTTHASQPWLFVEEDETLYLNSVTDSAWGNVDSISDRHQGRGSVAHIDGSVVTYQFTRGRLETNSAGFFDAWKTYLELSDGRVVNMGEWQWPAGNPMKFGYLRRKPLAGLITPPPP